MDKSIEKMSIEEKKELLKKILLAEKANKENISFDSFAKSTGRKQDEILGFNSWIEETKNTGIYSMETMRMQSPKTSVEIKRQTGEKFNVLNFSSYNYLGYAEHPEVIKAAKEALDQYGLGATASPLASGTLEIHKILEDTLLEFFDMDGYGISLFTSGFGTLIGVISAYIHKEDHIIMDSAAHASILDGALLSQGKLHSFYHNDMEELDDILRELDDGKNRILICSEGCYSADGDYGNIKGIVKLAKKYGASTLVDEAHSILLAGPNGKGVCEEQGVLEEVDMLIGTFSKGFSGVGGFLLAKKEIANYINVYARSRMFSCALDPAVTGGMIAALKLAMGSDGKEKRERIRKNSDYLRSLLQGKVDTGKSSTWIIPVICGVDNKVLVLIDYLQKQGLDVPIMVFPAVPKNKARIRLFLTSEHTKEQIEKAAEIILKAAEKFDFLI